MTSYDLTRRSVRLNLGGSIYDPTDPVGRLLSTCREVAEFEADLAAVPLFLGDSRGRISQPAIRRRLG